ncbi:FMN-binding negative transcriptional regulator [Altererythrobacter confluentis]|uniref:FMN-binding negative transcriptional regulator n=1 Tax=Allopontixanthobacter confluentis TaxID=1849021 RepID=A0A6L7GD49_9SPHN|nr:FMN-binding negative transcriptional regulator [Allopontixanthobacter confluentis]MXP13396.1 FMN-binding negative transcriptional regulator [Allopontixanthobacter confluentis]
MHPAAAFRHTDHQLHETLIEEVGFGMVFAQTPDGPRVGHTPLIYRGDLSTGDQPIGDGTVQFHLSARNALTKHLAGTTALLVVNGPDAYVSSRWYDAPDEPPTWNYVALELEGPVRRMDAEGLSAMLETLTARHEARIQGGKPWTMDRLSPARLHGLMKGIVGFEMDIRARRDTVKLSQNKSAEERSNIAKGLEENGSAGIAQLMRTLLK